MEYRYRNIETRGTIRIAEDTVKADIARGFTKWSYEAPLNRIHPHPVYSWSFPSVFWACLLFGGLGIYAAISIIRVPADAPNPFWITYIILVLSLGLIAIAVYAGREEWVSLPTEIDRMWIRYSRSGPDRERFDEFTTELCSRISEARARENEE